MNNLSEKLIWNNNFDLLIQKLLDSLKINEQVTLWQNNGQKRITAEAKVSEVHADAKKILLKDVSGNGKLFNINDALYFHCPRRGLLFKTKLIQGEGHNLSAQLPDNYRMLELRLETRMIVAPQVITALMDVAFESGEEEISFNVIDISPSGLGLLIDYRNSEYSVGQKLFLKKLGDFDFDYVMPGEIAHLTPIRDFSTNSNNSIHLGLRLIGELPADILFDLIEI